tara:strand:- start:2870 stop:3946 length:1077 start_codon:yes stop_codon:yes gene_type:complete
MKIIRVLGIETSCDETSVSVVQKSSDGNIKILSNIVRGQLDVHKDFGGVVPELAARAHSEIIDKITLIAIRQAKIKFKDLNAIAATAGPGLLGGLIVGTVFAKTMASALKVPFIAVNHLEGHALSILLEHKIGFPYLLLLVSGGHTEFTVIKKFNSYKRIGTTLDDALGEAFDKTARLLNLGYPGGPLIEKCATRGDPNKYKFPLPLIHENNSDFSFSGLKSSVAQNILNKKITEKFKCDISASFQKTIVEILLKKTQHAINTFNNETKNKKTVNVVVAGGVAANQFIRGSLENLEKDINCKFHFPSQKLCTDNGAMIAYAGIERYERDLSNKLNFKPRPRWPLDKKAIFMKGKRINA